MEPGIGAKNYTANTKYENMMLNNFRIFQLKYLYVQLIISLSSIIKTCLILLFFGISGVAAVRKRGRSNNNGRPPSDEFGQLHRNSTVIDGELLLKKGQIAPVPDAVSLVSEGKIKYKNIQGVPSICRQLRT